MFDIAAGLESPAQIALVPVFPGDIYLRDKMDKVVSGWGLCREPNF
jgi:hypothetical protein